MQPDWSWVKRNVKALGAGFVVWTVFANAFPTWWGMFPLAAGLAAGYAVWRFVR